MERPLVLVVEDSRLVQAWLSELLAEAGFRVVVADDGHAALAAVEDQEPDLVLTDVYLPGLAGPELVRRLRERPGSRDVPVVVHTCESRRDLRLEMLGAGVDEFLLKPADPEELLARIRTLAEGRLRARRLEAERDEAMERARRADLEVAQAISGLVATLETVNTLHDIDTGEHVRRVGALAGMLARAVDAPERFAQDLERFAGLHDVGKVGIRHEVLKKPGRLTPEEFEEMKAHTFIGAELIQAARLPQVAANVALHHHERWDGQGYPHRMAGDAIPLEARIVSVVDVYDALVNPRCYKRAFTADEARAIMVGASGTQLDPSLVETFFRHERSVRAIARDGAAATHAG